MSAGARRSTDLPVTILGGYLGAGKTTLVNHLLRHAEGRRIAVLVNDFGSVNVDADLIEAREGAVLRLAGGCACCTIGSDFTAAIAKLPLLGTFDHVVVEASGVALPRSMETALSVLDGVHLASIVVVADAATVRARAEDPYVGDVVRSQLASADVLILNRTDTCPPSEVAALRARLTEWNPRALALPAVRCVVDPGMVLARHDRSAGASPDDDSTAPRFAAGGTGPGADRLFTTWTLDLPGPTDAARMASELAGAGLERAKGIVLDRAHGWVVLQVVGERWSVEPAPGPATTGGRVVCVRRRTPHRGER